MAVKINGLKYLDANRYDEIMIREKDGFQIDVKAQNLEFNELLILKKFQGESVFKKISTELKDKTDYEKLNIIIKKYLEYSNINGIANTYHLVHYDGWFRKISGTRNLYLQISNPNFQYIYLLILKKYIDDRLKFCYTNNEINNILINTSINSSYSVKENSIDLELMRNENGIAQIEKEFIIDFISNKLSQVNKIAYLNHNCTIIKYTNTKDVFSHIYITCGNLNIEINGTMELLELLEELITNHNNELEQSKKMQLKLEGF